MKLFDYLNAINTTKNNLLDTDDEQVEKKYAPFVVNRCLSYFPDTILQSNNMNIFHQLEKKMQFDYLIHSIRPRKRFSKWLKNETDENLEIIKRHYDYSNKKAREVIGLLSDEHIQSLKDRYGGASDVGYGD